MQAPCFPNCPGRALKRSFPQLQPAETAMAVVMGLPTSSPPTQKKKKRLLLFCGTRVRTGKVTGKGRRGWAGGREDQRKTRPGQALHPAGFIKPHTLYPGQRAWTTLGPTLSHPSPTLTPRAKALESPGFPAPSPLKGDPESCSSRCQFWRNFRQSLPAQTPGGSMQKPQKLPQKEKNPHFFKPISQAFADQIMGFLYFFNTWR